MACFRNVASHLEPGGCFLIEVEVPALQRVSAGGKTHVFAAGNNHWGIDEIDVATQGLVSHHFVRVGDGFELTSVPFRYVWPAELDLMAQLADMRLLERWGGWQREPFTRESGKHVSVWEKPRAPGGSGGWQRV